SGAPGAKYIVAFHANPSAVMPSTNWLSMLSHSSLVCRQAAVCSRLSSCDEKQETYFYFA
ncbi:hypothetical protein KWX76_19220, partial [Clostridioides difficile]|nr:hypothetical protein [Clostridioides difficile]